MPVYTTYISGSGTSGSLPNTPIHGRIIGAQITGSLHVKGSSSITGSIDATAGGRFGNGINISAGGIFSVGINEWTGDTSATGRIDATGEIRAQLALSSSGGLITTGAVYHGDPSGAVLLLRRDDVGHITDGELIGAIDFWGQDTNQNGAGARIAASASLAWENGDKRQTDLKFFTQDDTYLADGMVIPRLIISGGGVRPGCVGIDKGLFVHATASMKSLQVGGDYTTPGLNAGYPLRVSNTSGGDVGIAIDSDNNRVGSINFTNDDPGDGGGTGLYVDWAASTPNRVSIRRSTDLQENGALVIHSNMNSVRVGGGAGAGDTADNVSLLVTSSLYNKPSIIRLRTKHGSRSSDAYPVISWMHEAANSGNTGHWAMGIDPDSVGSGDTDGEYLRVCATSPGSSAMTAGNVAMTFREGGTNAGVGIGGDSTRAMIPTGTLHVENQKTADYVLTKDLDSAQLILGNSANNTGNRSAGVYFSVSTSDDPEFHSAHIANVNTSGTAAGYQSQLSFAVNDGSGLKDSVRQRLRIDSQGAVLIVSGTNTGAGSGFPKNDVQAWEVHNNDIPSGSLTVTSLSNAGGTGNNLDPATISLISWPGNQGKGNVPNGYNMGRIQWWSADDEFGGGEENKTVSGYIQGIAAAVHGEANLSPMAMEFYVRNTGGLKPDLAMKIRQTGIVEFQKSIVTLGASLEAIGVEEGAARVLLQADLSTDAGDDWSISANAAQTLTFGNDIANAGAYVPQLTITPHATVASSEVTAHGKLKVDGGIVTLDGTGRINDEGGDTRFYFTDGGNTIIGGATGTTSATFSDTDVTIAGNLFTSGYARLDALRVGTTSTDPGDGNLYVEGEVQTPKIAFTDGDDAINVHDKGILSFPAGVRGSPAVNINDGYVIGLGYWIKFAESPINSVSSDTTSGAFLIELQGIEQDAERAQNVMMVVSAKYTYKNSAPYYYADPGPKLIVDIIHNEDNGNWDPADYISLEVNQNGSSSLWFRQGTKYNNLFVTHLGAGPDTYMGTSVDNITDPSWVLTSGESWVATKTAGDGASIAGQWPDKKYNDLTIVSGSIHSTSDLTFKPIGGDVWIHDGSNNRFRFDAGSVAFHMIDDDNASDYFKIGVSTGGETTFTTVDSGGSTADMNFEPDGNFIVSSPAGWTLDAAGFTGYMKYSGTTAITYTLNSTPVIAMTGNSKIDSSGTLEIECTGNMTLDVTSNGHFLINGDLNPMFEIGDGGDIFAYSLDANSGDYYMRYDASSKEISYTTSTKNVKENIRDLELDYAPLLAMRPVMFDFRSGAGGKKNIAGFIAEEISLAHPPSAALGPDLKYDEDGAIVREIIEDEDGELKRQEAKLSEDLVPISWDHAATVSYLVKIIQDMHARIEALENN